MNAEVPPSFDLKFSSRTRTERSRFARSGGMLGSRPAAAFISSAEYPQGWPAVLSTFGRLGCAVHSPGERRVLLV